MPSMLVTGPVSAYLDSIEYEDEDPGMLAYSSPCAVSGARRCAARIDRHRCTCDFVAVEHDEDTLVSIGL